MNVAALLRVQAQTRPDAPAILDTWRGRPRITTFVDLDEQAARAATLLEQSGLRPGDAVLVLQPMSLELYVALLAIFRLRLTAMFLDPSAGLAHVQRCCELYPPRGFLGAWKAHLLRLLSSAIRRIPLKFMFGPWLPGAIPWSAASRLPPQADVPDCPPNTPALLTFTSGSTGQPKAAIRTHGFLLAQHRALEQALKLTPGDVDLTTLPVFLLANLASGVTSIIPDADLRRPGAIVADPVIAQAQRHAAVSSAASPAFLECLVRRCAQRDLMLPSFRKVFTGGAPVFPRMLDQLQALAPNAEVVAVYGSTEAEPIAEIPRRDVTAEDVQAMVAGRGLLAGPPVDAIRLRILRHSPGPVGPFTGVEFATNSCQPGQTGEIVVSGEHVLPGYLHGRGDEETKFHVDETVWHRTGDAGYLDERSRLWLLGRCSARIEDGRGTVYPFAVECAAYQDARIRRAAAVGHRGRRLLAVEPQRANELPDLDALRESLAWAQLDDVRLFRRIPVDARHNAKIDYPALYRLLDKE